MKYTIEVEVREGLDFERLTLVLSDTLYLPENVTQEDYDLVMRMINSLEDAVLTKERQKNPPRW